MPAASRLGDLCTGHGPWPPRLSIAGSPDVVIEGSAALRVGDAWAVHCAGACHGGAQASGSGSVFVNGRPLARIGDAVDCGSAVASGAATVFAGG